MLGDEQDSFEQQQSPFRPTELAYCRSLVDLLTEELDDVRRCLGRAQRANHVLVTERDDLVAERFALKVEVQSHRLHYVQFV